MKKRSTPIRCRAQGGSEIAAACERLGTDVLHVRIVAEGPLGMWLGPPVDPYGPPREVLRKRRDLYGLMFRDSLKHGRFGLAWRNARRWWQTIRDA